MPEAHGTGALATGPPPPHHCLPPGLPSHRSPGHHYSRSHAPHWAAEETDAAQRAAATLTARGHGTSSVRGVPCQAHYRHRVARGAEARPRAWMQLRLRVCLACLACVEDKCRGRGCWQRVTHLHTLSLPSAHTYHSLFGVCSIDVCEYACLHECLHMHTFLCVSFRCMSLYVCP